MPQTERAGDFLVRAIAQEVIEQVKEIRGVYKRLYSLEEAATYLGQSEDAVRDLITQGRLKPKRLNRKVQFDYFDLKQLVDSLGD